MPFIEKTHRIRQKSQQINKANNENEAKPAGARSTKKLH
jgi:hypothetical protein